VEVPEEGEVYQGGLQPKAEELIIEEDNDTWLSHQITFIKRPQDFDPMARSEDVNDYAIIDPREIRAKGGGGHSSFKPDKTDNNNKRSQSSRHGGGEESSPPRKKLTSIGFPLEEDLPAVQRRPSLGDDNNDADSRMSDDGNRSKENEKEKRQTMERYSAKRKGQEREKKEQQRPDET